MMRRKDAPAEIEAVVEEIERIQNEMGIEKLPSPWLPPLAERIPRTLYPAQEKTASSSPALMSLISKDRRLSLTR